MGLATQVFEVASLVARGYTPSGSVPGGRLSRIYFWPWATIVTGMGALALMAGTMLWVYRLIQLVLLAVWWGVVAGN